MAKTSEAKRDLEREANLVEVDGEFCVPFEADQTRHYIDLGPFELERSSWYFIKKVLFFLPAIFLFILAIQLMKSGAIEPLYRKWFMSPIPPTNANLNFPMTEAVREAYRNPSNKGV